MQLLRGRHYRDDLGIHFGAIRKPRLGNTQLIKQAADRGWILDGGEPAGTYPPEWDNAYAKGRNIDFSQQAARDWYAEQMAPFYAQGASFWWNDEGETDYFTNHWWNTAEVQALASVDASKRFYSLNRAWTPGMARLGAAAWTGDIMATWEDLQTTPGMMLNWIVSGAPYVACDIGGFGGNTTSFLLSRWMQVGAFMPQMRIHSVINAIPHWPWRFGPNAAHAIKKQPPPPPCGAAAGRPLPAGLPGAGLAVLQPAELHEARQVAAGAVVARIQREMHKLGQAYEDEIRVCLREAEEAQLQQQAAEAELRAFEGELRALRATGLQELREGPTPHDACRRPTAHEAAACSPRGLPRAAHEAGPPSQGALGSATAAPERAAPSARQEEPPALRPPGGPRPPPGLELAEPAASAAPPPPPPPLRGFQDMGPAPKGAPLLPQEME
ncbi:unnamed protein product [Prorocentrum cordatum]|uniref:Glycoside hydrolase family 31 TIM barrel domain-containing protein n=1 Tax=Prorocentrum cordatum TaxID=2364126 RepID=A0ABN9TSD7_9DINO|nr:unnamed protein product [Polarella glacialis]